MPTKKKTNIFVGSPVETVKPDYLTQEQWEYLKSDKEQYCEKTEKAKIIVAKILERDPHHFD